VYRVHIERREGVSIDDVLRVLQHHGGKFCSDLDLKRGAVCATLLAEPNALPTFIVIALSAGRELLVPASAGALAACLLVAGVGLFVHRPLARVPENTLKFAVGVMLTAFGIYWTGEGLGVAWPGADLAIVDFAALFLAVGRAAVVLARRPSAEAWSSTCCELCFAN